MRKKSQAVPTQPHKSYHAITTSSYQPAKIPKQAPRQRDSTRTGSPLKKMLLLITAIILSLLLVIAVWNIRNFTNASQKLFGTDNAWEVFRTQPLKTSADGRTNILLVGYSVDDPGHGGADLTDSILVVSLDSATRTGYMLSIPRDLYVNIPDYGYAKINEAYQAGEHMEFRETGRFKGGMGLLQKVVGESFDIDLHYFALVNYASVKEIVDALGGVEVTITSEDQRGIYDPNFPPEQGGPLRLSNGKHMVDGQTALRLTRARGATYGSYGFPRSDFNRTQHQQQVFMAIKNKLDWKLVLDPRTNGLIFDAAGDNVKTNIKIGEVIPLYRLLVAIPDTDLRPLPLSSKTDQNLLAGYTTPTGQSALIPAAGIDNFSEIQAMIRRLNR